MKKLYLPFILLVELVSTIASADAPGTSGFQFLRNNTAARPAALGGAFVAVPGDINGINYNPAGIAALETPGGSVTYIDNVLDFKSSFIAYYQPFAKIGTIGLSINYIGYGEFKKTDESGKELGTFGSNSFAIAGSMGRFIKDRILIGASAKYIYFGIDNFNSTAVALDGGIIYKTPIQDLNIGVSIFNVGTVVSAFITHKDELPLNLRAGFSKRLAHLPLLINGSVYKYRDDIWQWQLGGEFNLSPRSFLRLGYDSIARDLAVGTGKDVLAGISIGFGILLKRLHIDFSITSVGEIGSQNRISLSGAF